MTGAVPSATVMASCFVINPCHLLWRTFPPTFVTDIPTHSLCTIVWKCHFKFKIPPPTLLQQPLRIVVVSHRPNPMRNEPSISRPNLCTGEPLQPSNPPKRRWLSRWTTPTWTGRSLPPRSYPVGLPRRGWSILTRVTRSWSAMRTATRRPRRGASRRRPTLPTITSSSSAPTHRPPSRTFSGQASPHDRTPRAHLHQSPICLRRGRRNRGHRNANRAGRRIGVAM